MPSPLLFQLLSRFITKTIYAKTYQKAQSCHTALYVNSAQYFQMRVEGNRARARNDAAKRGASFGIIIHRRYANHGAKVALVLKSVVPLEPECFIRMKSTFNSLVVSC